MYSKRYFIFTNYFLIRRKRKIIITSIVLIVFIVFLLIKSNEILFPKKCEKLKSEAINEICLSYKSNQFVGQLCHSLCDEKTLKLTDCPNIDGHNGKDYVFVGQLSNQLSNKIVLKARTLTTFELIGNNNWKKYFKNNKKFIIRAINDLMIARFGDVFIGETVDNRNDFYFIDKLLTEGMLRRGDHLNETVLLNLWLLIQDNEYVMSRYYPTIFPPIVGTCGHFYGVQYSDQILDFSYFLPNYWFISTKTIEKRLEIGGKLMDFLTRFQTIRPKLELCDIKFEHFGFFKDSLLMIDSDMIYTKRAAIHSIESLSDCKDNSDCDFIDCKGICRQNKCSIDETDDDLKRLCRNIFFMEKLYNVVNLGLFSGLSTTDHFINTKIYSIERHCFQRTNITNDIKTIQSILFEIQNYFSKINKN